ncbi:hypothetical protein EVAR_67622_1 [Eumeta japonica]|uniref:Uncharacterized protein n=1 Tax=Eumeta variegata TaxID=151549 RepID=A0A4C2A1F1_EUMVA|nr:hypothetical protein EVAR_67622_1 [Eumeta japonica]
MVSPPKSERDRHKKVKGTRPFHSSTVSPPKSERDRARERENIEVCDISKYMKNVTKRFLFNLETHLTLFYLRPSHIRSSHHSVRRPRNVLSDSPDVLTTEVEGLIKVNNMAKD